jgi:transcriptional regulator with PAS, ATPase and Fis domain
MVRFSQRCSKRDPERPEGEGLGYLHNLDGDAADPLDGVASTLQPGSFPGADCSDAHECMRVLFDPARCGVFIVDRQRRIRYLNRVAEGALGRPPGAALGEQLGVALFCNRAMRPEQRCGATPECLSCEARELVAMALSSRRAHRSRVSMEFFHGGMPHEVELEVGASRLSIAGQELAILAVEGLDLLPSHLRGGEGGGLHRMVGGSDSMLRLFDTIRQVGPVDVPVLVEGESGTGKELVAHALHRESRRGAKPMVAVNCAALAAGLLESELFGHVKGAFTGAVRDKKGRFELAHGGTILLDEIGEISPEMQVRLLRVLQDGTFERVGGEETIEVDVRLICTTNRDLEQEVAAGRFRADLYYRLCVVCIKVPALRDRIDDIPVLAEHIVRRAAGDLGLSPGRLSAATVDLLTGYSWPGNVRQLENALRHALVSSAGGPISPTHLPHKVTGGGRQILSSPGRRRGKLDEASVRKALAATGGNKVQAARRLGVGRATLYRFLARNSPGGKL